MSDSKILQAILDGLTELRENFVRLEKKVDDGFKSVNDRIDNLGMQLAELEDDAPTIEEFNHLEKRVTKLEKRPLQMV